MVLSLLAEIVATCSILLLSSPTAWVISFNLPTAAITALSIPRFKSIGFAPAATFFKPPVTMACANTVAVVVPSPATSAVLLATSFNIWAPMFSTGSTNSISFATVTPSFVMCGAPNFLSITTLRPLGPKVTLTAFAKASTPLFRPSRADRLKSIFFAMIFLLYQLDDC